MNAQETNRTRGFPKAPKLEGITASESEAAGSALGFPKKRNLRHCLLDQTLVDEEEGLPCLWILFYYSKFGRFSMWSSVMSKKQEDDFPPPPLPSSNTTRCRAWYSIPPYPILASH
jgi:hypothetical protein